MRESIQIRRNAGRHDFIPAYSTAELLHGVCHITRIPNAKPQSKGAEERVARFAKVLGRGQKLGREAIRMRSRVKFEANKDAIYEMLSKCRSLKYISEKHHMGEQALKRFLEEDQPKRNGARYPYLERLRQAAKERKMKEKK